MIDFIHRTNPRSKSLRLTIDPNGQVIVTTHPLFPRWLIAPFVHKNAAWIEKNKTKVSQRRQPHPSKLSIFGKEYEKSVVYSSELPVGVTIQKKTVIINTVKGSPGKPSLSDAENYLERFLKQTAEKYIVPRTHQLAKNMGITFGRITLRQQKTRWGSCSSQGNLNFNWQLVHYQPEIIDYVIVHELAHRQQMNHSRKFWDIVRQYDPAFEQHRGWLRRHGWTEA